MIFRKIRLLPFFSRYLPALFGALFLSYKEDLCFFSICVLSPIIRQMETIQNIKDKPQQNTDHAREDHAGQFNASELYRDTGQAGHKHDGRQCLVACFAVVDLSVYQDAQPGSADHPIQQK